MPPTVELYLGAPYMQILALVDAALPHERCASVTMHGKRSGMCYTGMAATLGARMHGTIDPLPLAPVMPH